MEDKIIETVLLEDMNDEEQLPHIKDIMNDEEQLPHIKDIMNDEEQLSHIKNIMKDEEIYHNVETEIVNDITNTFAKEEVILTTNEKTLKSRIPYKLLYIIGSVLSVLIIILLTLYGTKTGRRMLFGAVATYIENQVVYDDGSDQEILEVQDDIDITEADIDNDDLNIILEEDIEQNTDDIETAVSQDIINILIIGEETIESYSSRGRTDLIMIASMNVVNKTYTIISLMRDMYVSIPGHDGNKLNAAYQIGGIKLLYETIESNFKITIDGYLLVQFDGFEKIIDNLGGLPLSLSRREAEYLRITNYISDPSNRNVKEGIQLMNGNQVLGYCRVRHVPTAEEADDYGRTKRHRIVLNSILDKIKTMDSFEMLKMINTTLPYVITDLLQDKIAEYMELVYEIGFAPFNELRIPAEGTYESGYVRQMFVLLPNLADNINLIHDMVYGINN